MTEALPNDTARLRKELALNRKTAAQMIALRGIPTQEVAPYYARTQALSTILGDQDEIVNSTWGLWSMYLMVAELDQCLDASTSLVATVKQLNTPVATLINAYMSGVTHAYRGSLDQAVSQLETVLQLHTDALKDELLMRFGMDIGLTANSFLGWVYALLGRTEAADAAARRALLMAQKNNDGLSLVFANVFAATKCLFLDQRKAAKDHADKALKGADEMGYYQWSAQARMQLARVADLSGEADALTEMQDALECYLDTGMVLARPYAEVWIAEAQARRGQYQTALATLETLGQYTNASEEKYFHFAAENARDQILEHMISRSIPLPGSAENHRIN